MKSSIRVFVLLIWLTIVAIPIKTIVAATAEIENEGNTAPAVLCLPGIYMYDPGDCLPAGPSSYLTRLAEIGISIPVAPLSYSLIDSSLSDIKVHYGEVRNLPAPVYGSMDDAIQGNKKQATRKLDGYFVYISYTEEQEINGKRLYMIDQGAWMKAADVSRVGVIPRSQGILFSTTPHTAFGWILTYFAQTPQIASKRTPGYEIDDYTSHLLNLYDIVPVFGETRVGEENWYLIGPDEWLASKYLARVVPNTTPPAGVSSDRWIEVNLLNQTLVVYDKSELVFATMIASGADPFWTRPGVFQIFDKKDTTPMTGSFEANQSDAYYLEDVPWTMYFDKARALHGAYWRAKMGFPQSHGCVNLTVGDAHWLYDWAQIGDWVYVWDPSGQTPTDESQYSTGGY
jgi:hypothetical protein